MYMFPVIGLLIGAFSADSLSQMIGLNRNVGLFIFTVLGLTVAVFIARGVSRRMERNEELTPVVFRILQRAKPPHAQRSARQP
jgi:positive regulator of sigma E activity